MLKLITENPALFTGAGVFVGNLVMTAFDRLTGRKSLRAIIREEMAPILVRVETCEQQLFTNANVKRMPSVFKKEG